MTRYLAKCQNNLSENEKIQKEDYYMLSIESDGAVESTSNVATNSEADTAACGGTHSGHEEVQDGQGCSGHQRDGQDLACVETLAGDEVGCHSDNQTLKKILENAYQNFFAVKCELSAHFI
jgi:hypothetical protein